MTVVIHNGSGTYDAGGLNGDAFARASSRRRSTRPPICLNFYVNGILNDSVSTAGAHVNDWDQSVNIGRKPVHGDTSAAPTTFSCYLARCLRSLSSPPIFSRWAALVAGPSRFRPWFLNDEWSLDRKPTCGGEREKDIQPPFFVIGLFLGQPQAARYGASRQERPRQ